MTDMNSKKTIYKNLQDQVDTDQRRFVVKIKSLGERKSKNYFTGCLEGKIERRFRLQ